MGRDIALRRADQKTVHPLPLSKVPTWRAYISLFDKEKVLNTKKVAGHSEEWAEVPHQEQVLLGQDLDHRVIKLSNGQNFYDQAGRFDRVIDYFDHQVLLDDQGFHPSKNVQSIRLVRSVDPAGQKTSWQDFAIYNRPFTVYYHGEMTLNNGETIPLRPTQLTVFQENLDQQSPLDSQRRAAFATIKKQGEYLFSLIQHLKPKLLDQVTADYGQKIQTVVSDANQKLDQGQTTTEIQLVQKDHLDQLMVIQNQATQNQPLAPALLNTNRDLAYQQLDQEALSTKVGINNAQRLNQEQKRALLAKVGAVAQTGKNEIGLAPDVPAVRRVLLRNVEALRAIFVSQDSKEDARLTLVQAGQKRNRNLLRLFMLTNKVYTNKKKG
ncbi:DUF1542 domain-containing protein [Fructobacillus americanaquae]|uniref:DUF1542 domain-containing protein n=1 Tax=Fructobacillus americanaquae TaxID=2940302 RepID=A0ABY5C4M7_9LACO|nr:DUF1542 domain-containing protein [Fructobacillus americanaquae]USS92290.1 DUF1542 domain-containing protein [Fructobacillus americanaquae]